MKETPQERMSKHLALMADTLQHQKERPPHTYEALRHHQMMADSAVCVALKLVHELLPEDIQVAVTRLVELHDDSWHHRIETQGAMSHDEAIPQTQTSQRLPDPHLSRSSLSAAIVHHPDHVARQPADDGMATSD